MFNKPCKDTASEKKVKSFCTKSAENVDKMEFLLISPALKGLNRAGFRKNPCESPQEIPAIHDFSASQLNINQVDHATPHGHFQKIFPIRYYNTRRGTRRTRLGD
jgi:hypothetical protein